MHKRLIYDLAVVVFFFMLITVATHELVHVFQFMQMGNGIESVCILGVREDSKAIGWVIPANESGITYDVIESMEKQAYAVTFVVMMFLYVAFFLIVLKLFAYYYGTEK